MIEEGVMKNPKVDYVFGLHITCDPQKNESKSNFFSLRPGPIMAAPDTFVIRIAGKGGHGAAPQDTIDPVYVAAQVMIALQGVSGRTIDPVQPFVITIGSVHSGTKENIIPDEAVLQGTIRTLDEKVRRTAKANVQKVVQGVAKAFGAKATIEFEKDAYPITINNQKVTERTMKLLKKIPGTKTVIMEPILGGEDFSRFLQEAPGTFYFLGTKNTAKGCVYPNHSSRFKVDEDVLKYGTASLTMLAAEFTSP